MQLVKLLRDGEVVRMSKRTGKAISLTDLLDEVPVDACPLVLQRQAGDADGVRSGSGRPGGQREPGVLCAVRPRPHLHPAEESGGRGLYRPGAADAVDFSLLADETEQALIKQIASYGQVVLLAARDYDPSHINRYLTALAAAFHKFYAACRIKGEEKPVLLARLKLADTTRAVLKNAMTLIGCSAPEKM